MRDDAIGPECFGGSDGPGFHDPVVVDLRTRNPVTGELMELGGNKCPKCLGDPKALIHSLDVCEGLKPRCESHYVDGGLRCELGEHESGQHKAGGIAWGEDEPKQDEVVLGVSVDEKTLGVVLSVTIDPAEGKPFRHGILYTPDEAMAFATMLASKSQLARRLASDRSGIVLPPQLKLVPPREPPKPGSVRAKWAQKRR